MNKFVKLSKKKIAAFVVAIISFFSILFIIIFKALNPFKPTFFNYSSYADTKTVEKINEKYTYKEYATVADFEYAFENNKSVSGVTSDYTIINLINNFKIAPISKKMVEINKLNQNWESYFSPATIEQMQSYNKFINEKTQQELRKLYPEYGNYQFKFSDFVVPYFINDRVLAFNTKKILGQLGLSKNPFNFSKAPRLEEALKKLTQSSETIKIQWTKNERENVAIGSTENDPEINWNTKINQDNYITMLENFASIVENGTNAKISDLKVNLFDNDSDIILNNVINPAAKIEAAMIYNGDALDAYYGHDNFQEIEDGDRLRIIRTKYTIRVLDAFVVSSSISDEEVKTIIGDFSKTLFNGMFKSKEEWNELANQNVNVYETDGIMRIFDYVNYTPAAKGSYEYILENYFLDENGNIDEIAQDIYQVAVTNLDKGIYVGTIQPIEKEVLSKLVIEFQRKINGF